MNVDLVLAMIKRREFESAERARKLATDPTFNDAAIRNEAIAQGMKQLLKDIREAQATEDRDS